jgi:peptidyl-dipeptidase A
MCFRVSSARWAYSTNMTDHNKRRMIEEQTLQAKFDKLSWKRAMTFDWTRLPDQMVRRQLKFLITNSRASLSDEKYNEVAIKSFVDSFINYSCTQICCRFIILSRK